jgi:phosphate acetyltransferase
MNNQTGTGKYERLLERCKGLEPIPTAVAHPCEETALSGAIEAGQLGLIRPILVGPVARMREIAARHGIDLGTVELVDAPHSHAAAARAVELVREGKAELLMKGSLHSDELLGRSWPVRPACAPSGACPTSSSWMYRPTTRYWW